jgi:hypothetical protein
MVFRSRSLFLVGAMVLIGLSFWIASLLLDYFSGPTKPREDRYVVTNVWADFSGWRATNLRTESIPMTSPSLTKVTRLTEDDQNTWRGVMVSVPIARENPIRVNAEIKGDDSQRRALFQIYAGPDRFSCNFSSHTGATAIKIVGGAKSDKCTATPIVDGWWGVEVTGSLSINSDNDPLYLVIAVTKDDFREGYQGDGKSGLYVGKVTLAKQRS